MEGFPIRNGTYLKMALNMLLHSKLRSWLTIIGIVIGVGAVVGIISLGDAMETSVQKRLADMDLSSITITPGYSRAQSEGHGFGGQSRGGSEGDETVEITPEELAEQLATQMYEVNADLALASEAWDHLPEEGKRAIVEQARYVAALLPHLKIRD